MQALVVCEGHFAPARACSERAFGSCAFSWHSRACGPVRRSSRGVMALETPPRRRPAGGEAGSPDARVAWIRPQCVTGCVLVRRGLDPAPQRHARKRPREGHESPALPFALIAYTSDTRELSHGGLTLEVVFRGGRRPGSCRIVYPSRLSIVGWRFYARAEKRAA